MPKKRTKKSLTPLLILAIAAAVVIFVLIILALVSFMYGYAGGTAPQPPAQDLGGFCGSSTYSACSSDSDCMTGGCSGQICRGKDEEPKASTCEWRDCYDDEKYGVACACLNGRCAWKKLP